jgi:Fe-S-cluster containining protein
MANGQVFGVNLSSNQIPSMILEVQKIQNKVPESKCLGCPSRGGIGNEVVADCCRKASPPLYYIEFLSVLQHIETTWNKKERADLLMSCFRTFLNVEEEKPCVLLNLETSACRVYRKRWTNCRTYGMVTEKDWEARAKFVVSERLATTGKFLKKVTQTVMVPKGKMLGLDGKPMYREIEVEQEITDAETILSYVDELFKDGFDPDRINSKLKEDYGIEKAVYHQCRNIKVNQVALGLEDIDKELRRLESKLMGTNIGRAAENPTYLPFHTYFLLRSVGEAHVKALMEGRFKWNEKEKEDFLAMIEKNVENMV